MSARTIVLAAAILAASCGAPPVGKAPAGRPPVPVELGAVERRDVPVTLHAVGSTAASTLATLRPQVTAPITAVRFAEGATVEAGAVLIELDRRAYEAALAQAEAELARTRAAERQALAALDRDRAQLALAGSEDRRMAEVGGRGLATEQQIEAARSGVDQARAVVAGDEAAVATARASLDAAEAAVATARLELSWCTVTAPITGRTGSVGATVGNLAVSGQTELARIAGMQPMHVWFSLPLAQLPALREAMRAGPVAVSVQPEGGTQAEDGVVELVENGAESGTGSVRIRASLANAGDRLWPDMQCRVEVRLGDSRGALVVPVQAVQTGQRGPTVWVVGADMSTQPRPVRLDRVTGGTAVIADGLAEGERIVLDGQLRLTPGCTVSEAGRAGGAGR